MITKSAGERIAKLIATGGLRGLRGRIRVKSYAKALGQTLADAWKELENMFLSQMAVPEDRLEELRALHDPERSRSGSDERALVVEDVAAAGRKDGATTEG